MVFFACTVARYSRGGGRIAGAGSPGRVRALELKRRAEAEIEALRERMSSLSGAVLRISASLDVGTVLREVVDGARALTGARYGAITTIDEAPPPPYSFPPGPC